MGISINTDTGYHVSIRELLRTMRDYYEFSSVRIQKENGRILFCGSPDCLSGEKTEDVHTRMLLAYRVNSFSVLRSEELHITV